MLESGCGLDEECVSMDVCVPVENKVDVVRKREREVCVCVCAYVCRS